MSIPGVCYRVNAITLLISIISLGNSENRNEVGRLEAIFDLMDFSHNSQISLDELVRNCMYVLYVLSRLTNLSVACNDL
jgi:hypothetical protein